MSNKETEKYLSGIHSELKRLNDNIENIISKIDNAAVNDNLKKNL